VLLDGKARLSCITLAATRSAIASRPSRVVTPDGLDELQKTFDECGALQCGFCQPGMILAARACPRPQARRVGGRDQGALASNLCRCPSYTKIFEAVERATRRGKAARRGGGDPVPCRRRSCRAARAPEAAREREAGGPFAEGADRADPLQHARSPNRVFGPEPPGEKFEVIGRRMRKVDAAAKATGEAIYTDDVMLAGGCCTARRCAARIPTLRIRRIDVSKAEALEASTASSPAPRCRSSSA